MEKMKKILWLDDDFGNAALRTEFDDLTMKGYQITGIRTPDEFDEISKGELDYCCFVIDVSLPVGTRLDVGASKKGMRTGIVLLNEILGNSKFSNIPMVVYTIVTSDEVTSYCQRNKIKYIDKGKAEPWTLSTEIENLLK